MKELVEQMVKGGYSQNEFEILTTESLNKFCERRRNVELKLLAHEIGHTWGPTFVTRIYHLDCERSAEYLRILGNLSVREILALQLAVGSSMMAKGPVEVVKFLFNEDNMVQLFTLIVLTGNRYELVQRLYALFMRDTAETMLKIIRERENLLLSWIYNSQIHISGVIEDASRVCARGRGGKYEEDPNNLTFAGFFFPHNLATVMNAEIRDLMKFIAPVILPIFGGVVPYCFPALPVRVALGNRNFSILRYVMDGENLSLAEKEYQCLLAPMAYAMLKSEEMVAFNVERIRRARHSKVYYIVNELGPAEWVHGPIDRTKDDCAQFINVEWSVVKSMLKSAYQELNIYTQNLQQELTRMKYVDATISSNLAEHPLNGMTPRYNMRRYIRQRMGFGLRDKLVRNRYIEMHNSIILQTRAMQGKVQPAKMTSDQKFQLHKELFSLQDVTEWSKEPTKLKNLPPLVTNMIQAAYQMDLLKWKEMQEERFKRGSK